MTVGGPAKRLAGVTVFVTLSKVNIVVFEKHPFPTHDRQHLTEGQRQQPQLRQGGGGLEALRSHSAHPKDLFRLSSFRCYS